LKVALQLNETATTWKQRLVCEDMRELKPDKIREPEQLAASVTRYVTNCCGSKLFVQQIISFFKSAANKKSVNFGESGQFAVYCLLHRPPLNH
jgi:hypothetical protein